MWPKETHWNSRDLCILRKVSITPVHYPLSPPLLHLHSSTSRSRILHRPFPSVMVFLQHLDRPSIFGNCFVFISLFYVDPWLTKSQIFQICNVSMWSTVPTRLRSSPVTGWLQDGGGQSVHRVIYTHLQVSVVSMGTWPMGDQEFFKEKFLLLVTSLHDLKVEWGCSLSFWW